MLTKICSKCKIDKSIDDFNKRKDRKSGILSKCKECCKKYRDSLDKVEVKKYRQKYKKDNKVNATEYHKIYWAMPENIKKRSDYYKTRRKTDSLFKLKGNIKSLIFMSFKNKFTKKSKKTIEILGCTFEEFKIHLEKQFDDKMNWNNQGTYWQLDHIKPISLASDEQELIKLNHYTNFQPLYWVDNQKKSNTYDEKIT